MIGISLSVVACVHRYQTAPIDPAGPSAKLDRKGSVYVGVSKPGVFGAKVYQESGAQTSAEIARSLAGQMERVVIASGPRPYADALSSARRGGFDYLIVPKIQHWEERATEWSGKPDRIRVEIFVYEVRSGALLGSVAINGVSRWATFGGDHPEDLLKQPIEKWAVDLF